MVKDVVVRMLESFWVEFSDKKELRKIIGYVYDSFNLNKAHYKCTINNYDNSRNLLLGPWEMRIFVKIGIWLDKRELLI